MKGGRPFYTERTDARNGMSKGLRTLWLWEHYEVQKTIWCHSRLHSEQGWWMGPGYRESPTAGLRAFLCLSTVLGIPFTTVLMIPPFFPLTHWIGQGMQMDVPNAVCFNISPRTAALIFNLPAVQESIIKLFFLTHIHFKRNINSHRQHSVICKVLHGPYLTHTFLFGQQCFYKVLS